MNCLSVAHRELCVAARHPSTFWLRVAAGATGVLIGSGAFILTEAAGTGANEIGRVLFYLLSWICLAVGLSTGLFFTSDCISEEKREGTLGLLFLTELHSYDVVLGKVAATSLRSFYGLLAVLPILAITQLMGGISGAQYAKTSVALVNALFFSISAGMLVSTLSRDSQKAMIATLVLLLLLSAGGPLADLVAKGIRRRMFQPYWSFVSPAYTLATAGAWGRSPYWTALLVTQAAGWAMLGLACAFLPQIWQEKRNRGQSTNHLWCYRLRYGSARARARLRRRLLDFQPVTWLLCRERWQAHAVWLLGLVAIGGLVAILVSRAPRESWVLWYYVGGVFTSLLYFGAASQACRFHVAARRGGMMELILVTSLPEHSIVRSQWRTLCTMFAAPVVLLLTVHVAAAALSQLSFHRIAAQVSAATAAAAATNRVSQTTNTAPFTNSTQTTNITASTNVMLTVGVSSSAKFTVSVNGTNTVITPGPVQSGVGLEQITMASSAAVLAGLRTIANLIALCWFGMWMGMTSRSANLATLKTLLVVQIIPWLLIAFLANVVVLGIVLRPTSAFRSGQSTAWLVWWPLLTAGFSAGLTIAKDIAFTAWARARLHSSFRHQASKGLVTQISQ